MQLHISSIHWRKKVLLASVMLALFALVACSGDTGTGGAQGPAGPAGTAGAAGPDGAVGPVGVAGLQGKSGLQGIAGISGAAGPMGVAGPQGKSGLQGIAGPPGPAGATGLLLGEGEIKSTFNLVENPSFVSPITGASGTGTFVLDGGDLDDLVFQMAMEAVGLMPNTWYYLSATVRENFDGGSVPVAMSVVGTARTDDGGRLEFEGVGVLPNVFDSPATPGVTQWRIDQQVRLLGSGELANCVECILVCSPTTKVELVNGKLVQVVQGEIKSTFNLVENPSFVSPIIGAGGTGTFVLDGGDLDSLEFKMEMDADGLMPNTWYYLSATVRENFDGGSVPVAMTVVGTARTDDAGRLEFEGVGFLPNVFDSPATPGVTQWRIDQQVRRLGSGELGNCVECILVCSPTTKVELVDGKLVPFVEAS